MLQERQERAAPNKGNLYSRFLSCIRIIIKKHDIDDDEGGGSGDGEGPGQGGDDDGDASDPFEYAMAAVV